MTAIKTTIPDYFKLEEKPAYNENGFFSERFQKAALFGDILALNISLFLGIWYLENNAILHNSQFSLIIILFVTVNLVWLTTAIYHDLYLLYATIPFGKKSKTLLYVYGISFAILSTLYHFAFSTFLNDDFLLATFLFFLLVSSANHLFFRNYYQQKMPFFRYAIIGGNLDCNKYINKLYSNTYPNKTLFFGYFSSQPSEQKEWLGNFEKISEFLIEHTVDKLFYIDSNLSKVEVNKILSLCENRFIDFEVIPQGISLIQENNYFLQQHNLPVLSVKRAPLERLRNMLLKRIFDICFSLLVIVFLFPILIPAIGLFIKLESNGPVFFKQKRLGYWNKAFNCYKFRTMHLHAENHKYRQAKSEDPRITKFGSFLRKTNLDEFPQFLNVLFGEMSIVGPRPHPIKLNEESEQLLETYMVRHKVKPGITGWAQINGFRGPTETIDKMKKRVEYDVHYMKNWTFLLDIHCIFFTVINMIKGEENAF